MDNWKQEFTSRTKGFAG